MNCTRLAVWMCAGLLLARADPGLLAQDSPARPASRPAPAASLLLPYAEYQQLQSLARAQSGRGPRSHLTTAEFVGRPAADGSLQLSATFAYRHLPGVARSSIELLNARAALVAVSSEPPGAVVAAAPPVGSDSLPRFLLTSAPGQEGTVTVEWLLHTDGSGPVRRALLAPALAGDCRFRLELADPAAAVSIEPALAVERLPAAPGFPVRLSATLRSQPVRLAWGRGQTASSDERPAITLVRQSNRYVLSRRALLTFSRLEFAVSGAPLVAARLVLPAKGTQVVRVSPGEFSFLPETGALTVTFSEPVLGPETLSLELRQPLSAPLSGGLMLAPPHLSDEVRLREGWLSVQTAEPLEVVPDPASPVSATVAVVSRPPPDLLPPRGLSTRLLLSYRKGDLVLPLVLGGWPATRALPLAGEELAAETRFLGDGTARNHVKLSAWNSEACTLSVALGEEPTCSVDLATLDGRPVPVRAVAASARGDLPPRGLLDLPAAGAGGVRRTLTLDGLSGPAPVGLAGVLTLRLPAPEFPVKGLAWRIEAPRDYVFFDPSGPLRPGVPPAGSYPSRFGAEALKLILTCLLWLGLPAVGLLAAALVARRALGGEPVFAGAAGVVSILLLVLVLLGLYALAVPIYRRTLGYPAGPASGRSDPEQEAISRPGLAWPPVRHELGQIPMSSAASSRDAAGEDLSRLPPPTPVLVPAFPALADPRAPVETAARPEETGGARLPVLQGERWSDTEPGGSLRLTLAAWMPPVATPVTPAGPSGAASPLSSGTSVPSTSAATAATAEAGPAERAGSELTVSFRYVQAAALPILQGLSVLLGLGLFLLLWLCLTDPSRAAAHGAGLAAAFLALWLTASVLPPGQDYGATGFALPLVLTVFYLLGHRFLSPRLRGELTRSLEHAAGLNMASPAEVQISDLFQDSDGISFVAERAGVEPPAPEGKD